MSRVALDGEIGVEEAVGKIPHRQARPGDTVPDAGLAALAQNGSDQHVRPAAQGEQLGSGGVPRRRLVEPFLPAHQQLVGRDHQGIGLAAGDAGGLQLGEQEGRLVRARAVGAGRRLDLRLVDLRGKRLDREAGAAQQGEAGRGGAGEDQAGRGGVWHRGTLIAGMSQLGRRAGLAISGPHPYRPGPA